MLPKFRTTCQQRFYSEVPPKYHFLSKCAPDAPHNGLYGFSSRMVNEGNRDNFLKLQASTNRVVLYSGPELSNLVIDYFNTLVDRINSGHPLLHDEQEEFLREIVNAMRAELGITK